MNISRPAPISKHLRQDIERFYEKPMARVSLELMLSLITVLFFAVFALRPTINTMSRLLKDIEDRRVIEEGLTKKMAALSTAQGEVLTYGNRLQVFQSAVPTDVPTEDILYILELIAARTDVTITNLRISESPVPFVLDGKLLESGSVDPGTAVNTTLVSHEVRMTLDTDYVGARRFFRELESIRPIFILDGYSLAVAETRDRDKKLNINAVFSVPFYTTNRAAVTAEQGASDKPLLQRAAAGEDVGAEKE